LSIHAIERLGSLIGTRLRVAVAILALAYVLPGLVGHDPWKQDETYVTGIVYDQSLSENWIVPRSAGAPFLEKPPLYYLVAEESADALRGVLPLHDAARLTNVFWMAIVIGCVGFAARLSWPRQPLADVTAVLLLLCCPGLLIPSHMLVVDVALLAGFAVAYVGFAWMATRPLIAGVVLGTGVGLAFMAKGLLGPGCIGLTALLLPIASRAWRTRNALVGFMCAIFAALPWLIVWPLELYRQNPALFDAWLWQQNLGRFVGYAHLGAAPEHGYYLRILPFFALPALALSAWTLWQRRRATDATPMLAASLMLAAVTFVTLAVAGSMRAQYLLPLLVPLSVLGAADADRMPARVERSAFHSGRAFAVFGAVAVWLAFIVAVAGHIPDWAPLDGVLPREHIALPGRAIVALAFLATLLGAWGLRMHAAPLPGLRSWALGITLVWILCAALLFPWIDQAKSYRSVFESIRAKLPAKYGCVNSYRMGESEAAMLHYEGGVIAQPIDRLSNATCRYVIVQGARTGALGFVPADWQLLWSGHRIADPKEMHRLYRRAQATSS
jgi:4-amino-4-deoxy-L-arabinose transferase-like glycosyltransferase